METKNFLTEDEQVELLQDGTKVVQNKNLYKFTSDSIMLSKFATHKKGDIVADFCAGSGIVGFNYNALHKDTKSITFFEMQKGLYELCKKSISLNGFNHCKAVNAKLQEIGKEYNELFSLIVCNPPYERGGAEKDKYEIAVCRKEITITFEEIVLSVSKSLKFSGRFAFVHRADRLAELFYLLKKYKLEPKKMQFVCGRDGAKPYLVLVEATKGGKVGLEILDSLVNINN